MIIDTRKVLEEFVDYLMPALTPHEASMYVFLLRHSHLNNDTPSATVRMGQRTIAQLYGRGPKMSVPSRQHVLRQLESLEEKGCMKIGGTSRDGTLYTVVRGGSGSLDRIFHFISGAWRYPPTQPWAVQGCSPSTRDRACVRQARDAA